MCDKNRCHFGLSQQRVEILLHATRHIGVEIAEQFIEQQQHRSQGQGAGESHAFLVAAREFMRIAVFEAAQTGERKEIIDDGSLRSGKVEERRGSTSQNSLRKCPS